MNFWDRNPLYPHVRYFRNVFNKFYKTGNMKFLLFFLIILFFRPCDEHNHSFTSEDSVVTRISLSENQKKVLTGAKKCLEAGFSYDLTMGYYVCTYRNGFNTGSMVFPGGDISPDIGVCTDVIIRALRWGGVCDLQERIHNDIKSDWGDYPMKRWSAKKPDPNIDQRRVPVQMVWFSKYWTKLPEGSEFIPGDIVAWDMNNDGWGDHIGIVSDYIKDGVPYLIHNFPDPGYVAEENVLYRWTIIGHYRIPEGFK